MAIILKLQSWESDTHDARFVNQWEWDDVAENDAGTPHVCLEARVGDVLVFANEKMRARALRVDVEDLKQRRYAQIDVAQAAHIDPDDDPETRALQAATAAEVIRAIETVLPDEIADLIKLIQNALIDNDVCQAMYEMYQEFNARRQLLLTAVQNNLPEGMVLAVLDPDGDPIVDDYFAGTLLTRTKAKHMPVGVVDERGSVVITVPGLPEENAKTLTASLGQFARVTVLGV